MKNKRERILFITPSMANTGSEVLLYHFIHHLSYNTVITVMTYKRGSLLAFLPKSVKVHVAHSEVSGIIGKLLSRIKKDIFFPVLFRKYKKAQWYINTIVLPQPVKHAASRGIKFILHVHELEHMYTLLQPQQLSRALNKAGLIIANSDLTRQHLIKAGAGQHPVVINPFVDVIFIETFGKSEKSSESTFYWVMSGSIDTNKNPALFVSIAHAAHEKKLPYRFVWLYNSVSDEELFTLVKKQCADFDTVRFIKTNSHNEYLQQMANCQGLLLTSTHESFSIVTLEALALNMAIVVHDCGGVNEMLNAQVATIVRAGEVPDMFLKAMQTEAGRYGKHNDEKKATALKFKKEEVLFKWSELLSKYMQLQTFT